MLLLIAATGGMAPAGDLAMTSSTAAQQVTWRGPIRWTPTISERFHRETALATQSVPTQVWNTVEAAGWSVQLTEFVVDAAPALHGVRPRGWPAHLTWDNSDAVHLPTSKVLIVAEKRRNRAGQVVANTRTAGVLRHELGHAFDMATGGQNRHLSASTEFVAAYQRDVAQLSPSNRARFAYYLQGSRAGWEETFAEAFAATLGGGTTGVEPAAFESAFPSVPLFVRAAIEDPPRPASTAGRSTPVVQSARVTRTRGLFRRR